MHTSRLARRVGWSVVVAAACSWLVPVAEAQLFQNNGGNGGGTWYRGPQSGGGQRGNRGMFGEGSSNSGSSGWEGVVTDIFGAIIEGATNNPPPPRPPRPPQYPPNRPPYYPPNNTVYYPSAPRPSAPATPPPAPPEAKKNTVVKKVDPVKNNFELRGFGANATAETDVQQVIVAAEMEGRAQAGTTNDVDQAIKAGADPKMEEAWTDYLNDPSPEKLQKFKDDWGAELETHAGVGAGALLDVQIELGDYKQGLLDGRFPNGAGKDKAIKKIQDRIDEITNGPTRDALTKKLGEIQDLNDLGKLAEATQNNPNGLVILIEGATSAGFPPSLVGDMVGMPIMDVSPVTDKTTKVITEGTFLFNPAENSGPIHYVLGNKEYTMEPGYNQTFDAGLVISFNNGKEKTKKYTLGNGSYKFVVADDVWDLKVVKFDVTIDNSDYPTDFHFVMDNKQDVIRAGEMRKIESPYPIVLIFDRGDGGSPAEKRLLAGNYKVGLDASQTRIDLFDEETIAAGPEMELVGGSLRDNAAAQRAKAVQEKLQARQQNVSARSEVNDLLESLRSGR